MRRECTLAAVLACALAAPAATQEVTWARDVAPIVYESCVTCHRSGSFAPGIVRDISAGGVFFACDDGKDPTVEIDLRRMIEPGDQVVLTYETARFAKARRRLATVRWIGPSRDHGCAGLGLRFEEV